MRLFLLHPSSILQKLFYFQRGIQIGAIYLNHQTRALKIYYKNILIEKGNSVGIPIASLPFFTTVFNIEPSNFFLSLTHEATLFLFMVHVFITLVIGRFDPRSLRLGSHRYLQSAVRKDSALAHAATMPPLPSNFEVFFRFDMSLGALITTYKNNT